MSIAALEHSLQELLKARSSQQLPPMRLLVDLPAEGRWENLDTQKKLTELFEAGVTPILHIVPVVSVFRARAKEKPPSEAKPLLEVSARDAAERPKKYILAQVGEHSSASGAEFRETETSQDTPLEPSNLPPHVAKRTWSNVLGLKIRSISAEIKRVRMALEYAARSLPPVHEIVLHNSFNIKIKFAVGRPEKYYSGMIEATIFIDNPVRQHYRWSEAAERATALRLKVVSGRFLESGA